MTEHTKAQEAPTRWERALTAWGPVIIVLITAGVSLFTWSRNVRLEREKTEAAEQAERAHQDLVRREQRYSALVASLKGFHVGGTDEDKAEFISQFNQCWLYCSDSVILATYQFMGTVEVGANSTPQSRQRAVGEVVSSIRMDLIERRPLTTTVLRASHYKSLTVK